MAKIDIILANGDKAGETLKQLTYQAAKLKKELSDLKPGTDEFVKTAGSLNQVNDKLADIKDQAKSVNVASDNLKNSFDGILDKIPGFSTIKGMMGQAEGGVGGLTSSFGSLTKSALAFIATPIGAVIAAIVGVVTALTAAIKTDDETADAFGKKWDQIGAVFDVVIRRVGLVGKALLELSQGHFSQAWDLLKDSVSGVGDELKRAYDLSGDLADRQNQLDDDLNKFNATEQQRKNQIDSMIIQSKDRTKTEAERIKLETDAENLLQKLTKDRMDLTQRQSDIDIEKIGMKHNIQRQLNETTQQYGLRLLENSQIGGEEAKTISDGIRKVDEAQAESLKTLEKLQKQKNELLDKADAAAQKRAEQKKKDDEKAAAEEIKLLEEYTKMDLKAEDNRVAAMDESREKDLAKLKLQLAREIEAMNSNAPAYAAALAAAQELAREQRDDINAKWDKKEMEDQLKKNDLQLAIEVNGLSEQYLARQISYQEYLDKNEEALKNSEQQKLDIIEKTLGKESKEYQDQYKKILDIEIKFNKAHEKNAEDSAKAVAQSVGSQANVIGGIFNNLASLQEEGSENQKDFLEAAAIMQAIAGAAGAFSQALQAYPPPYSFVIGGIAAAAALAAGIANANKIKNTKVPKAKKAEYGMVLKGPSHAQGGIPIEAEGDEIIMTKGVYRDPVLRDLASRINVAGGGISFSTPTNPYNDVSRPAMASGGVPSAGGIGIDYDLLAGKLGGVLSKHVDDKIIRIQVHNNVQDTQKKLDMIKQIKNDSNV